MKHSPQAGLRFPLTLQRLHSLGSSDADDEVAAPEPLPRATVLRRKPIRRLLALFAGRLAGPTPRPAPPVAAMATRNDRLRALAARLEAILDELDAVGAQRVAIDVCMALERIKATLAVEQATTRAKQRAAPIGNTRSGGSGGP